MKKSTLFIAGTLLAVCSLYQTDLIIAEDSYWVDNFLPSKAQHDRIRFLVVHDTIMDNLALLKGFIGDNVIAHYPVTNRTRDIQDKPVALSLVPEPGHLARWHAGTLA